MNKKIIHIHIGMGKTGTTALQYFFWENRSLLTTFGIEYPEYGVVSAAHHLLSPHIPPFLSEWEFVDVEEWGVKLSKSNCDKILISSELISSASPQIIESFCKKISKWFEVKIIIYFRRQDNVIMAAYNQQVKAGLQKVDFHTMLSRQFPKFNYLNKLEPWIKGVAKQNIIVIPYERQQFYQDDIRKDFLHRVFGITEIDDFLFETGNKNPRLSYTAMEYKRLINSVISQAHESSQYNDVLAKYSEKNDKQSNEIYSNAYIAPPIIRLQILRRSNLLNQTIAREFLGRDDGVLFYEELPNDDGQLESLQVTDDDLKAITQFIFKENNKLIENLKAYIDNINQEDQFEVYYQAKRLEGTYLHMGL